MRNSWRRRSDRLGVLQMYQTTEHIFHGLVQYAILALEIVGVIIILVSAVRALIDLLKGHSDSRLEMAEGVATALTFLLGGEAMKTIIAPDWKDIGMTCAILLMRAAMSLLIHWETKSEKAAHAAETKEATGGADIGK